MDLHPDKRSSGKDFNQYDTEAIFRLWMQEMRAAEAAKQEAANARETEVNRLRRDGQSRHARRAGNPAPSHPRRRLPGGRYARHLARYLATQRKEIRFHFRAVLPIGFLGLMAPALLRHWSSLHYLGDSLGLDLVLGSALTLFRGSQGYRRGMPEAGTVTPPAAPDTAQPPAASPAPDGDGALDTRALETETRAMQDAEIETPMLDLLRRIERIYPLVLTEGGRYAEARYTLRQAVDDYLPLTLGYYRKVLRTHAPDEQLGDGRTAKAHLLEQIGLVARKVEAIDGALRQESADDLLANGRFLRQVAGRTGPDD